MTCRVGVRVRARVGVSRATQGDAGSTRRAKPVRGSKSAQGSPVGCSASRTRKIPGPRRKPASDRGHRGPRQWVAA
eukprot:scaffold64725_cov84-Phaeocystis_antarctica.AAC.2